MKARTPIGLAIGSAILGIALLGNLTARDTLAQESEEVATSNETAAALINSSLPATLPAGMEEVATVNENAPAEITSSLPATLPTGIDPAGAYAQLIRMVQSGVDESVMLAYIARSPRFFELDADDIIYLTNLGAPPAVIEAALDRDQQLMDEGIGIGAAAVAEAAPVAVEEPPQEITVNYFYDSLSPYGSWVYLEGYGRCWQPTVVRYDSSWRPYLNNGSWVYTDHGWYWRSNYSWGWATFHYGRWLLDSRHGWCWWPDTVWAPSWVTWRYDSSYCGWAPLPPYTSYRSGVGIVYRGSGVGIGFDFGLSYTHYTYVYTRYICDTRPWRHSLARSRVRRVYDQTRSRHDFGSRADDNTVVNRGIPLDDIPEETRRQIQPVRLAYDNGRRNLDGQFNPESRTLHVRRPNGAGNTDTAGQGTGTAQPDNNRRGRSLIEAAEGSVALTPAGRAGSTVASQTDTPAQRRGRTLTSTATPDDAGGSSTAQARRSTPVTVTAPQTPQPVNQNDTAARRGRATVQQQTTPTPAAQNTPAETRSRTGTTPQNNNQNRSTPAATRSRNDVFTASDQRAANAAAQARAQQAAAAEARAQQAAQARAQQAATAEARAQQAAQARAQQAATQARAQQAAQARAQQQVAQSRAQQQATAQARAQQAAAQARAQQASQARAQQAAAQARAQQASQARAQQAAAQARSRQAQSQQSPPASIQGRRQTTPAQSQATTPSTSRRGRQPQR